MTGRNAPGGARCKKPFFIVKQFAVLFKASRGGRIRGNGMEQKNIERYFDWAATAPIDEDIAREALEESIERWGNPSALHSIGKDAKACLESARERCAAALGADSSSLFFTSGGTESDCIPLLSLLNRPQKGAALISCVEHPAISAQAESLKRCGWRVEKIPANKDGIVTADAVVSKLTDDSAIVCVMAVNNETGAIMPIQEIARALIENSRGKRKPLLHVDCVQAAGKIPLSLEGVDSAAFSAHKIRGPRGIGLLRLGVEIESFLRGGGQEKGVRSGTENVFGAVALAKCLERYCPSPKNPRAAERLALQKTLCERFIEKIAAIPGCEIIPRARMEDGKRESYSPWIVQAAFKNIPGQVMERALDAEGFFISTGSACSSRKNSRPVLEAMGVDARTRENAVRFSFGPATQEKSIDDLAQKVKEVCARFK